MIPLVRAQRAQMSAVALPPAVGLHTPMLAESVESVLGTWWVAWTRVNQEQLFVADCDAMGWTGYCPLTARWLVRDGKNARVYSPAFAGYAFVALPGVPGDPEHDNALYLARGNKRISANTFLEIRQQRRFVDELSQVQRALEINPEVGISRMLVPGAPVEVVKGPYRGMKGFVDKNAKGKMTIRLTDMSFSAEIEISADCIEPIQ
jgi:transcription antitermination factor NusG